MKIDKNPPPDEGKLSPLHLPARDIYRGLLIYVVTLWLFTGIALCYFIIQGPIQHKVHLHGSLFCCGGYQFSDFTDLSLRVAHFGEPHLLTRTDFKLPYPDATPIPYPYPVPSIYAFLFFVRLFPHPLVAYLSFVVLLFFLATSLFALRVRRISSTWMPQVAIWSTLVAGFPLLFLLDRGNIEAVIWALVLAGLIAYTRNRMWLAAVLWSIAASMKIFPALLFILFLARRKYGIFVTAIILSGIISVLSLAGVGPTIHQAALDSARNAPFLVDNYILTRSLPQFDHSLFQAVKHIVHFGLAISGHLPQMRSAYEKALLVYNVVVVVGLVLLYWFRLRLLPVLNQFIAYIVLCVLLPYVSNEYTLIYMYMVCAAFLVFLLADVATGRSEIPASAIYGICFSCAVIFAPLAYLHLGGGFTRGIQFGGLLQTMFLMIIFVIALRFPMPSSLFGDLQSPPGKLAAR